MLYRYAHKYYRLSLFKIKVPPYPILSIHKSKSSLVLKTCTATCTRVLCWRWWPNHFSNRGRKCFKMRQYFGSFQQRTHSIGYSDLISRFCCLQIYEIYVYFSEKWQTTSLILWRRRLLWDVWWFLSPIKLSMYGRVSANNRRK